MKKFPCHQLDFDPNLNYLIVDLRGIENLMLVDDPTTERIKVALCDFFDGVEDFIEGVLHSDYAPVSNRMENLFDLNCVCIDDKEYYALLNHASNAGDFECTHNFKIVSRGKNEGVSVCDKH